jgi:hypothetical protein
MSKLTSILTAAAVMAAISPAAASSSPRLDGQLPMYPRATLDPKITNLPASAIAQGVPLVMETPDSIHAVDVWYGSNTPQACARQAQSGGVQYKCAGGTITIYMHGGTQIALIPAFPH